jgi:hypothetical protein
MFIFPKSGIAWGGEKVVVGVLRGSFLLYKFESGIFKKKIYICYMSVYTQEKFNADSPNTVVPVLGGG